MISPSHATTLITTMEWKSKRRCLGSRIPRDTETVLCPASRNPCSTKGSAEFCTQELALMKSPGTLGCGPEPQLHPWEVAKGAKEVLIENSQIPEQNWSPLAKGYPQDVQSKKWLLEILEASLKEQGRKRGSEFWSWEGGSAKGNLGQPCSVPI